MASACLESPYYTTHKETYTHAHTHTHTFVVTLIPFIYFKYNYLMNGSMAVNENKTHVLIHRQRHLQQCIGARKQYEVGRILFDRIRIKEDLCNEIYYGRCCWDELLIKKSPCASPLFVWCCTAQSVICRGLSLSYLNTVFHRCYHENERRCMVRWNVHGAIPNAVKFLVVRCMKEVNEARREMKGMRMCVCVWKPGIKNLGILKSHILP